ncbi:MAG: hypothetical protein M3Y05_10890 [Gemmatimonadota bacterium]|nr:hypothetical protein [Gemmatimonadota bacterium]
MAKKRTAAEWAAVVAAWGDSGLGGPVFAARAGVSIEQLRWWKWHLAKRAATEATPKKSKRTAMVRVELRARRVEEPSSPIEIVRDGWVVRVRRGVDGETLENILDVIAARSPC